MISSSISVRTATASWSLRSASSAESSKTARRATAIGALRAASVRWCSAYLKIDVGAAALRGQARFEGKRTLFVTGERAEESAARA